MAVSDDDKLRPKKRNRYKLTKKDLERRDPSYVPKPVRAAKAPKEPPKQTQLEKDWKEWDKRMRDGFIFEVKRLSEQYKKTGQKRSKFKLRMLALDKMETWDSCQFYGCLEWIEKERAKFVDDKQARKLAKVKAEYVAELSSDDVDQKLKKEEEKSIFDNSDVLKYYKKFLAEEKKKKKDEDGD